MPIVSRQLDSDLGRWTHTEWRPSLRDPLEWAVERIWDFDGMAASPRERVLPNGLVELIVQLDDRYYDVHKSAIVLTPAACVTGIHSRPLVIQAPRRRCRVLGIRLQPAGAWALLAHPLYELADVTVDLGDILGRLASNLAEQCHDAGSAIERVRRAMAWIGRYIKEHAGARWPDPAVHWIANQIASSSGSLPIRSLRAQTGLGDARLTGLFRQQIGVTPKCYARIHRFGRALTLLTRRGASLSEAALAAGYYDQPHMNAEFRVMAGVTPKHFLNARRFPSSLSLPEST